MSVSRSPLPTAAAVLSLAGAALTLPRPDPQEPPRYDVVRAMLPPAVATTKAFVVFDVDGDGVPDLYTASAPDDRMLRNDGAGAFRDESWRLPNSSPPGLDAAAGDLDGDGTLDLVIGTAIGSDRLYLNAGGLLADASAALPSDPQPTPAVALGDVDGDGDLDVWLGDDLAPSRLYRNDGLAGFVDATASIPSGAYAVADVALGDVDLDGDLDAAIAVGGKCFGPSRQDRLYLNDGAGAFADATDRLPVDDRRTAALALGDVDGDLDLDLLLADSDDCVGTLGALDRLYVNDGTGTFVDASAGFAGEDSDTRACVLGDVDGDGDLDALLGSVAASDGGYPPFTIPGATWLRRNDGAGVFAPAETVPAGFASGSSCLALADADGDADLDAVTGGGGIDRLHLNDGTGAFALLETILPPGSLEPVALLDVDGDGALDLLAYTLIPAYEPFQPSTAKQRLFLGDGAGYLSEAEGKLPGVARPFADAALGDVDGDGEPDLMLACAYDGEYHPLVQDNLLYLGEGSGGFSDATDQLPTFVGDDRGVARCVRLVDVNADGDLDAVFAELEDYDGGGGGVTLFRNDGAGWFHDATEQVPYTLHDASFVEAGDVDADGDLDLVAGGFPWWVALLLNDGAGSFTDGTAQLPPFEEAGDAYRHLGLGDVDGDHDLDVVFGGVPWLSYPYQNRIYANDGAGIFSDASAGMPQFADGYLLADVDEDGDLDLLGASTLLANDGAGAFSLAPAQLPPWLAGERELGDLDGDGDLDALVSLSGQDVVWSNLTRHLAWRGLPRIGKPLALEVYGAPETPWLLAVAPGAASLGLPPYGTLALDAALLKLVASGTLDAGGRATAGFPVPADPGLVGTALHWQALVGAPPRFTNREVTVFTDL
jgi:hypothetical protein